MSAKRSKPSKPQRRGRKVAKPAFRYEYIKPANPKVVDELFDHLLDKFFKEQA